MVPVPIRPVCAASCFGTLWDSRLNFKLTLRFTGSVSLHLLAVEHDDWQFSLRTNAADCFLDQSNGCEIIFYIRLHQTRIRKPERSTPDGVCWILIQQPIQTYKIIIMIKIKWRNMKWPSQSMSSLVAEITGGISENIRESRHYRLLPKLKRAQKLNL